MKKYFVILFVLLVALVVASPVYAQDVVPGVHLDVVQIAYLGTVTTLLIGGLRFIIELSLKAKLKVHKFVMQLIVFAVAALLTWSWFQPVFPAAPTNEPGAIIQYIGDMYTVLAPTALVAFAFYDYFVGKIRDNLGGYAGIAGFIQPGKG